MQLDSMPRFIACGPKSMQKLLQVEISRIRQELEDMLEICRAEIRAARRMASVVVKLFQIKPPIPPVAIELINEIGELFSQVSFSTSLADLIIQKYKLILVVNTKSICHVLTSMQCLDLYLVRLFHSYSNSSHDSTGQSNAALW